tara:strand:+ start:237 stop:581 length:345 start_codon:yes stop_codon:yes gene_type:complete
MIDWAMKNLKNFLVAPLFLMIFLSPIIESQDSKYDGKFVRCDLAGMKVVYVFQNNLLYVVLSNGNQRTETIVSSTETSATFGTNNNYTGKITIDFKKNTYADNYGTIKCEGSFL